MLAEALARLGAKVLCVDMDYHAILSRRLGYDMYGADSGLRSTSDLMQHGCPEGMARDLIQDCRWDHPWAENIKLIPASRALSDIESNPGMGNVAGRLHRALAGADDDFHVTLCDTRPDMGKNTQAVWAACNFLLGITPPLRDGAEGLLRLLIEALSYAADLQNPDLRVAGVVLNEFYDRSKEQATTRDALAQALASFNPPIEILDPPIPRRTYIEYAGHKGIPLIEEARRDPDKLEEIDRFLLPLAKTILEVTGVTQQQ